MQHTRANYDDVQHVAAADVIRGEASSFQARNRAWMDGVFAGDPTDLAERVNRFSEEALELGQSLGQTAAEAHALVDYVHGRPIGEPAQEIGGTMTTLALLAECSALDMMACGEAELARCSTPEIRAKIREKRSKRHGRGPLPGTYVPDFAPWDGGTVLAEPKILEAAEAGFCRPGKLPLGTVALTIEWPDGEETSELVSPRAAAVLGYHPEDDNPSGMYACPCGLDTTPCPRPDGKPACSDEGDVAEASA